MFFIGESSSHAQSRTAVVKTVLSEAMYLNTVVGLRGFPLTSSAILIMAPIA